MIKRNKVYLPFTLSVENSGQKTVLSMWKRYFLWMLRGSILRIFTVFIFSNLFIPFLMRYSSTNSSNGFKCILKIIPFPCNIIGYAMFLIIDVILWHHEIKSLYLSLDLDKRPILSSSFLRRNMLVILHTALPVRDGTLNK